MEQFLGLQQRLQWCSIQEKEISTDKVMTCWERFQFLVWGGERYDTSEVINKVIKKQLVSSC